MKKLLAIMLGVVLVLSLCSAGFAAEELSAEVYITIADENGKLAVAAEKINVTDMDGDGALTVNDTLYAAHEQFYEGGADAGYATEVTQWGLGILKLWGTANGGSYGYYVNNVSAWSLADVVNTGDYVAAYVFTQPKTLDDKYSYFDKLTEDIEAGEVTLTLTKADYDKDWNPITVPVEGAIITVDGVATGVKSDAEGKATIKLDTNGRRLVSATADDQVIVPPVYIATVSGGVDPVPATAPESATVPSDKASENPSETVKPTEKSSEATDDSSTPDSTTSGTNTNAVQTGRSGYAYILVLIAAASLAVIALAKKRNED